jgi:glycosyl transferase family 87
VEPRRRRTLRAVGGWIALAVGIAAIVLAAARAEQQLAAINFTAFDDWRTYANAVNRWMSGEPIYARVQVSGPYQLRDSLLTGFTYPPAAVPLFTPFAFGTAGLVGWITVNLGAFLLGLVAVLRQELGEVEPLSLGLTLIAVAAFPPFSNAVVAGNLNLGIAGVLAWLWVMRADRVSAALAGVGAILKIFPGLLAAWPFRRAGWRAIGLAAATALGVLLVTLPLVGVASWVDFGRALMNAQPECSAQSVSIACALDGPLPPAAARLGGIGVSLILVAVVMRARSEFVAYAALAGALLAPVVDMHPHYWLIVWVVAFVGVARIVGRRRPRRLAMASA